MTNIEIRTRDILESLTPVERKVASFFLSDVNSVFHMPIARLAEVSGASQVAWVRFSKSLGFYGLKDLKKELFSELNRAADAPQGGEEPLYADISGNNTVGQMAETVCAGSIQAIEETLRMADSHVMERVAEKLLRADSIKLFGVGASALAAEDFYNKLLRIGKNVVFCRDNHIQLTYAANLTAKDVGVFFSYSGSTREVVETLGIAKARGATIVTVTKFGKLPMVQKSDFALFTASPEVYRRSGAMSSRIAQLVVVDMLYTIMANMDYHRVKPMLENSYNSCNPHRLIQG
ncbi:MAG: MurR/RpiR family transcriptional regulator [Clostridiales bacterium]|nr:MurR/RpiR family transcriptional regulator [Clostridiales bacterium]